MSDYMRGFISTADQLHEEIKKIKAETAELVKIKNAALVKIKNAEQAVVDGRERDDE